jgi:D-alanyl-D-alanine carboxypeptidase
MMYTRALPLATVCLLALACAPGLPPSAAPAAAGPALAPEVLSAVDSIARAAVSGGQVAGMAVAVSSGGRQVFGRGYGVLRVEDGAPVTDSTVFRIGSIAKQMTAGAIMRLEEEGRLSLSDPVGRYLVHAPAHWEAATIRHLLTHTSGIPSYTDLDEFWAVATEHLPAERRIGMVRDLPLSFEPGSRWAYSNTGYLLLGEILERVDGRPYGRYVQEELLAPLGLRETGACSEADPRMAQGYRPGAEVLVPARTNQVGGPFADGDLCSSVRDLLRWTDALASGRVVRPGTYQRMITRARLDDGTEVHYGFGFDVMHLDGVGRIIEHGGGVPGFIGHLAYYPERGVAVAVLTNTFSPTAQTAKRGMERAIFASLLPAVMDLEVPVERLAVYEGTYELYLPGANMGPFPMRIFALDGRLMAEADQTSIPLRWQGGHEFVDGAEAGLRLIFEVVDGRALRLVVQRSGVEFSGERSS